MKGRVHHLDRNADELIPNSLRVDFQVCPGTSPKRAQDFQVPIKKDGLLN